MATTRQIRAYISLTTEQKNDFIAECKRAGVSERGLNELRWLRDMSTEQMRNAAYKAIFQEA